MGDRVRFRKAQDLISQGMRKDRVGRAEILLYFLSMLEIR